MSGGRRLRIFNVDAVIWLERRLSEVQALLNNLPQRMYVAMAPLPEEGDVVVEVQPGSRKRFTAYAFVARESGWVVVVSPDRVRVVVDTEDTHLHVPPRLVDRSDLAVTLTMLARMKRSSGEG